MWIRSILGVPLPLWSWERFCYIGIHRAMMGGKRRAIMPGKHRAAMPGKHRAPITGKVYPGQWHRRTYYFYNQCHFHLTFVPGLYATFPFFISMHIGNTDRAQFKNNYALSFGNFAWYKTYKTTIFAFSPAFLSIVLQMMQILAHQANQIPCIFP